MNVETLKQRLQLYLECEAAILRGQEYTIGSRRLRRPDLKEVRGIIDDLSEQIDSLENGRALRKCVYF